MTGLEQCNINLSSEAVLEIEKIEHEISRVSTQHTGLLLQAMQLLQQVDQLHAGRLQICAKFAAAEGVNPERVVQYSKTGSVLMALTRPEPEPSAP